MTNSGGQRIVHRGVAESALYADRFEVIAVKDTGDADDRIEAQQIKRDRRIIEIHLTVLQRGYDIVRQRIDINLEANLQCRLRAQALAHSAELFTFYRPVQFQRTAPKVLIAEGIETKNMLSVRQRLLLPAD